MSRKKRETSSKTTSESMKPTQHQHVWLLAILCLQAILGLIYWHYTPFGVAPDERPHAEYVQEMVASGHLPVFDASSETGYEFYQPPMYYIMAAPFYMLGRSAEMAEPAGMVRLLSLILGMLSVLAAYFAVLAAFPRQTGLAATCAAFIALLPTHVMMSSSVSNDILMELIFGLFLLFSARMLVDGVTWKRTIVVGAVLGLGLLAKMTCLVLFPLAVLVYAIAWKRNILSTKTALAHTAVAIGVSIAICGWWLVRNQLVYGDLLGMQQLQQSFALHSPKPEDFFRQEVPAWMYLWMVVSWTFRSFWGVFGHMNVFMPSWIYWGLAAISLVVLFGSRRGISEAGEESQSARDVLIVLWVTMALVVLAFLRLNTTVFQAQGRYLYPALIPISLLWAFGLRRFLPADYKELSAVITVGLFAVVQVVALTTCISQLGF